MQLKNKFVYTFLHEAFPVEWIVTQALWNPKKNLVYDLQYCCYSVGSISCPVCHKQVVDINRNPVSVLFLPATILLHPSPCFAPHSCSLSLRSDCLLWEVTVYQTLSNSITWTLYWYYIHFHCADTQANTVSDKHVRTHVVQRHTCNLCIDTGRRHTWMHTQQAHRFGAEIENLNTWMYTQKHLSCSISVLFALNKLNLSISW